MQEGRAKQGIFISFLLAFLIAAIISCKSKRQSSKSISIHKVGELLFRRSYASIQFDSTLNVDSIERSNPNIGVLADSVLLKKFLKLGLVYSNYGLIRSRFSENVPKSFELIKPGDSIFCLIKRSPGENEYGYYDLVVNGSSGRDSIKLEGHYASLNPDIAYLLLDIIPGGFKELVILCENYFMMGDNSDVYIYEIKHN